MKKFLVFSLLFLSFVLLTGCGLFDKNGSITGTITDSVTGEPIANVVVTVGTETVKTDTEGVYNIPTVKEGTYTLKASAPDYLEYSKTITIEGEKSVTIDINLIPETDALITGYVTDGRGGPAVEGATVTWSIYETTTDDNGYFELPVCANYTSDLFVIQDNRGTFKVQDVRLSEDEVLELEIPTRDAFNPDWSFNPPTITTNVLPNDELSGVLNLEVSVESDHPVFIYYVYLGGMQRYPYDAREIGANEGAYQIDTTLYPNGETYLRILAYDENENAALYTIPVVINNVDETLLPGEITYIESYALTFGTNIVFYSEPIEKYLNSKGIEMRSDLLALPEEFTPEVAPDGGTIMVKLYWVPATDVDGYAVYRSFDNINYELVGRVLTEQFDDYSAHLASGKTVWYKIVPYNSFGEGTPIVRKLTPLPAFNVYLENPANEATNVPLMPTFTWRNECSDPMPEEAELYSTINIWDSTDYLYWEDEIKNETSYDLSTIELTPGGVYSWDVFSSYGYEIEDETGVSTIISVAGEYTPLWDGTGSVNGEFIFTTTTETGN